ncbi:MAG: putative molybdenum carrier protein [Verrucomicrobia bacterium]|nr:putative molybdenum carrier protein [Verrucomicrobiota bacterium]
MHGLQIISGGQTGADIHALDWAISKGLRHGGWCPRGRLAEDGPIPSRYELRETTTADYLQRTQQNVQDSDGTVIFTVARKLQGGTLATAQFALESGKPCLHIHAKSTRAAQSLAHFIHKHSIRRLNVAGSRASKEPGVGTLVHSTLEQAFNILTA